VNYTPGYGLWVGEIKVSEEFVVCEVPQTRAVVSHCIQLARNKEGREVVAVEALMERLHSQKVRRSRGGGGGPFLLPSESGCVVGATCDGSFANVEGVGGNIVLDQPVS
jgi:hypothetical protein